MKNVGKRLLTFLLMTLIACFTPLSAMADLGGIGLALGKYFDTEGDVRLSVGFEIEEMVPYGEETVAMLGGILKHTTLEALLSGDDMVLSMCVDGRPAFSLTESRTENGYAMTTDLLPNRVLTSSGSTLDILFPETEERPFAFDVQEFVTQSEANYGALAEAILPYAEEKKSNYTIEDIGYAGWVRLAKLNEAQCTELMPLIMAVLGCGMDESVMAELENMQCTGGLTIALYRTEEGGEDIAVYIKGTVTVGENDKRALSYIWAFTREDNQRKDSYKLELTRQKGGTNKRTLELFRKISEEEGALAYSCRLDMESRQGATVKVYQQKDSLKGTAGETLSGTVTITDRITEDDKTRTIITEYKPDLTLKATEAEKVLTGTVDVTVTQSKKTMTQMRVLLNENPVPITRETVQEDSGENGGDTEVIFIIGGGSLSQNLDNVTEYTIGAPPLGVAFYPRPESTQTVNLDALSPEELAALEDEMFQYAAGYLLRLLPGIAEEDTGLLQDNMTQSDYDAFYQQVQSMD